jgi:hypothetical protein
LLSLFLYGLASCVSFSLSMLTLLIQSYFTSMHLFVVW